MQRVALLALLVLLPGAAAIAEDDGEHDLRVLKAKIRFRATDSCFLSARFPSEVIPPGFDPSVDAVSVTLGPLSVISLPSRDERSDLRQKVAWRWIYRERRSRAREGVRRLQLDLAAGRLTLRARRLDLAALESHGPSGMRVAVVLGEATFATSIDLEERRSCWRHRSDPSGPLFPPEGPPPDDTPAEDLDFRVVASGDAFVWQPKNVVVRNDTDWLSLFYEYNGDPPPEPKFPIGPGDPPIPPPPPYLPPAVDFEREIVAAVFLGVRPTGSHSVKVTAVRARAGWIEVRHEETRPAAHCVVTTAQTQPFVIVAFERRPGTVTFHGTVTTRSCP